MLVFFVYSFTATATSLNPSDTTAQEQLRQQERLNQLRQQQEIKPDIRDAVDQLKSTAPVATDVIPENETPCFTMTKIVLIGDSAHQFQFALDEVIANAQQTQAQSRTPHSAILGSCLGAVGINAVMARVQNAIIAKGFVTTRVLATSQDLKAGTLQLTVIPGRVNVIRFTPDSSQRANAWNALPMRRGDILNLRDIEQALENFKRVPTAEVDIQIEPASTGTALPTAKGAVESLQLAQPGLSDVVIRYQQRPVPFRIHFNLDDSGANSTGKYQAGTTLSGDNLLTLNDLFYVNFNHDLGGGDTGNRGNNGYTAHYSLPWDYWLFSSSTSSNHFHQTVAGASQHYVFSGRSQNAEVKVSRLVFRNNLNKTNLSLRGFMRKSNNFIDDTEVQVQRRRTGAQDALAAPEQNFGEGTSRMEMLVGDLNLTVPFGVTMPWGQQALQYSANLRGQANYTPLTPQDRFSIGSRFSVRGFDGQQTLIADHGWLIRNELIVPIVGSGQAVYWGLDYGEVGGQSSALLIGKTLAGTVIGLRGNGQSTGVKALRGFSYDVFLGKPINKPKGFVTHDTTAGFNVSWSY